MNVSMCSITTHIPIIDCVSNFCFIEICTITICNDRIVTPIVLFERSAFVDKLNSAASGEPEQERTPQKTEPSEGHSPQPQTA